MRKRYFLALAASVLCGMSVEALVPVGEKAPAAPGKPVSLLRSDDAKALPDSMIRVIDGENYLKFVYAYTDEGALSLMTAIRWDADAASWAGEKTYSEAYTYDENGRLTRSVREDVLDDGTISAGTTTNTYDDQGRLTSTYFVADDLRMMDTYSYEGDSVCHFSSIDTTYTDGVCVPGTPSRETRTLDEAGNVVKYEYWGFDEWLGDATVWYKKGLRGVEYDSLNRKVSEHLTWKDSEGVSTTTTDATYTYLDDTDDSYIMEQVTTENGVSTYLANKFEWTGDNPRTFVSAEKKSEDADWVVTDSCTDTYYYPTTVANERVADNAEPAFKAYAADGSLVITTTDARAVQVYGIAGACYYSATVSGRVTIANLPAGIYVIASGDETVKVSVR